MGERWLKSRMRRVAPSVGRLPAAAEAAAGDGFGIGAAVSGGGGCTSGLQQKPRSTVGVQRTASVRLRTPKAPYSKRLSWRTSTRGSRETRWRTRAALWPHFSHATSSGSSAKKLSSIRSTDAGAAAAPPAAGGRSSWTSRRSSGRVHSWEQRVQRRTCSTSHEKLSAVGSDASGGRVPERRRDLVGGDRGRRREELLVERVDHVDEELVGVLLAAARKLRAPLRDRLLERPRRPRRAAAARRRRRRGLGAARREVVERSEDGEVRQLRRELGEERRREEVAHKRAEAEHRREHRVDVARVPRVAEAAAERRGPRGGGRRRRRRRRPVRPRVLAAEAALPRRLEGEGVVRRRRRQRLHRRRPRHRHARLAGVGERGAARLGAEEGLLGAIVLPVEGFRLDALLRRQQRRAGRRRGIEAARRPALPGQAAGALLLLEELGLPLVLVGERLLERGGPRHVRRHDAPLLGRRQRLHEGVRELELLRVLRVERHDEARPAQGDDAREIFDAHVVQRALDRVQFHLGALLALEEDE